MNAESDATIKLSPEPASPGPSRSGKLRRWLIPLIAFLLGLIFGVTAILLYLLAISGNYSALATPLPPQTSDISLQVGPAYITHLIEKDLRHAGLEGVSNVRVTLATGDQLTIDGDDQIFLG